MDPNNNWLQMLMGGGAIGAGLGELFGGQKNPADSAMPYLNQIPGMMQGYLNPYMQAGTSVLPSLQNQYSQLLNGNFINNMGKNFQQSPGLQFQIGQATNAANRAAAAGGTLGTPAEQQNLANVTSGIANQDYYNWLDHAMGAYGMGLQGQQGLAGMGLNASSQMSQGLMDALMSQANLGYAGQQNQNQMQGGGLGSLIGGGLSLASMFGGQGNQGNQGSGSGYGMPNLGMLGDIASFFM